MTFAWGALVSLYRAAMWLGGLWCHQRAERSPHLWGLQLPLCWRCTGIAAGALALFAWLLTKKRLPPLLPCAVLALAMPLDVLQAVVSGGDGDNLRRLLTGILWGVCAPCVTLHVVKSLRERLPVSSL